MIFDTDYSVKGPSFYTSISICNSYPAHSSIKLTLRRMGSCQCKVARNLATLKVESFKG